MLTRSIVDALVPSASVSTTMLVTSAAVGASTDVKYPARECVQRFPEFLLTCQSALAKTVTVISRYLSLLTVMGFLVAGYPERSEALILSDGFSVYVGDRPYPSDFDPYYNQPKIYRQPRYYEYTSKKRKGNKVFKTTKVKDQYGHTVYKKTSSHKKKKWK